jgi:starch phosphorylase
MNQIAGGVFSGGDKDLFKPFIDSLLSHDDYMVLADYPSYIACQDEVCTLFRDKKRWTEISILNAARMGKFSSDRSIREYCEKIWNVKPVRL